jgi:lipopolysaccharide transport system ATP-binding protein
VNAPVLKVVGLGKAFREYHSEWQRVAQWFGARVNPASENWVLRDVSFSLNVGEAVGVMGQNGAGKSTLLKLITGTLRASAGDISVNGRVAAILELGMGFNPEFTGRQNVRHAAGLMGFDAPAIEEVMPDIEAFAEIGEYFDQPVRMYSSGMQMRVAFSVATAFRPDVLIVDEALSVGDAYFQVKSFGRIRKFREQGTSLLLVSHAAGAIKAVCDRALILDAGSIIADGPAPEICDLYDARTSNKLASSDISQSTGVQQVITRSGTAKVIVKRVTLAHMVQPRVPVETVSVGDELVLEIVLESRVDAPRIVQGFLIRDRLGNDIFGTNTFFLEHPISNVKGGCERVVRFAFPVWLGAGTYSISVATVDADTILIEKFDWIENIVVFQVTNHKFPFSIGTSWMPVTVSNGDLTPSKQEAP